MLTVLVTSLVWGSQLALITMGFSLSYAVVGFANFALFELVTIGAVAGQWANTDLGLPIGVAVLVSMAITGAVAALLNAAIFAPMREASTAAKMLASVGVAIVARQVVQLVFGASAEFFAFVPTVRELGSVRISTTQILVVVLTVAAMLAFGAVMRAT